MSGFSVSNQQPVSFLSPQSSQAMGSLSQGGFGAQTLSASKGISSFASFGTNIAPTGTGMPSFGTQSSFPSSGITSKPNMGFGTTSSSTTPSTSALGSSGFNFAGAGAPIGSSFGLGGVKPPATATLGVGTFGAPTKPDTTTAFGFGAKPAPTPVTCFGGGQPVTSGFGFGGGTPTASFGFGGPGAGVPSMAMGFNQQQMQNVNTLGVIGEHLVEVRKKYAPGLKNGMPVASLDENCKLNSECKFSAFAYRKHSNKLNAQEILQNRENEVYKSGSLWEQAESHNPDPENYASLVEYGVIALHDRFKDQCKSTEQAFANDKELSGLIELYDKRASALSLRTEGLKGKQRDIFLQILEIFKKIEVLRSRGRPLQPSETRYRDNLERLCLALQSPSQKLQEIMTLKSQQERQSDSYADKVSQEDLDRLYDLLDKQREGLEHLTDIITKDSRDLEIIRTSFHKQML